MALSGVVSTQLMIENPNVSIYVWVLVALVIGFACGTFNGLLTGKLGMHPMLATLGASYIYRGIAYIYHPVNFATPDIREEWRNLAVGRPVFGIYNIVLVAAFLFLFAFLFQTYTKPGRRIFASGSSPSSAKMCIRDRLDRQMRMTSSESKRR